jgi:hypothetical protein
MEKACCLLVYVACTAVYLIVAVAAGVGGLCIVWLDTGTACTCHSVMRQYGGFGIKIADAWHAYLTIPAFGLFA